ncbi:ABC transporter ATP-binding protein [Haloarchaeobius sp. DT45]|uniref:ABC transporter ATP-binding protein n=1 Tax=Haloarchaeobius sp. DT45 TaxID=3446116 RepID=UPI003F6AE275
MSSEPRATTESTVDQSDTIALRTENLTKAFGELYANEDVSLAIPEGELRAIIGPNGAGKTTFFNQVMGVLEPTSGSVTLYGEDITGLPEHRRAHVGIARSFQSNQLFTDATVLENVRIVVQTAEAGEFSLDLLGRGQSVGREEAITILRRLGLDHVADTTAKNLSHGDQRLLGIAMALATDPEVLLLDEPTSGMSPSATTETAALIEDIHDEFDLTMLLIEHDMDVVLSISDKVTVLNRGEELATGTPAEIQENQAVQDAYLGGVREEL